MVKIVRKSYRCGYCSLECADHTFIKEHEKRCSSRVVKDFVKKNNFRKARSCHNCKYFYCDYNSPSSRIMGCELCNLEGLDGHEVLVHDGCYNTPSPGDTVCDRYEEKENEK